MRLIDADDKAALAEANRESARAFTARLEKCAEQLVKKGVDTK